MEFVKYYQEELSYLRELGVEFSKYYPKLAPYLAKSGSDPDVERLLEGFAFLSAKTRQKIEDEIPEITESLFETLWPHLLRPIPSYSILKFSPIDGAVAESKTIKRETEVESKYVDGIKCRFRTVYDVNLFPVEISNIVTIDNGSHKNTEIFFRSNSTLNESDVQNNLTFFINSDVYHAEKIYFSLNSNVRSVKVRSESGELVVKLPIESIKFRGFDETDSILPCPPNIDDRYAVLQEYFSFRQKYYFFEITGLEKILAELVNSGSFSICIEFNKHSEVPNIVASQLLLYCTPIINLFRKEAEPIRLKNTKLEYRVNASVNSNDLFEIFEISKIVGRRQGEKFSREYVKYLFHEYYSELGTGTPYYTIKRVPALLGSSSDTYITLNKSDKDEEILSIDIIATNKNIPLKLKKGDICNATPNSPEYATFENVTVPTSTFPAPIRQNLHWMLIKSISFGRQTRLTIDSIKDILTLNNYPAFYNYQEERNRELKISSLESFVIQPANFVVKGRSVSGQQIEITVDERKYSNRGELYLFFSVMYQVFKNLVPINQKVRLRVQEKYSGGTFEWYR